MAVGPGLAPHRPPFEDFAPWTARDFAGTSGQAPLVVDPARGAGQAGSSTPGPFALVLCWCLKEPAAVLGNVNCFRIGLVAPPYSGSCDARSKPGSCQRNPSHSGQQEYCSPAMVAGQEVKTIWSDWGLTGGRLDAAPGVSSYG